MPAVEPWRLSASEAARAIASGALTAESLVTSCLQRIQQREPQVGAWAWLDGPGALEAARRCDREAPRGPLHGVPVGIKDVIDTANMPTAFGSRAFAGRRPLVDAECVTRLEASGAIILGKTVTAEFATFTPGVTTNPHDSSRTPGGSSSGSAAAVADGHVPLAIGTQTAGSVVRPASYCGVYGFKPTRERYPSWGVLETSPSLDTLGVFARSAADIVLADAVLGDAGAASAESRAPVVGLCRSPHWREASAEMRACFEAVAERLADSGATLIEVELPEPFHALAGAHATIHQHEAWRALGAVRRRYAAGVGDTFKAFIDGGEQLGSAQYEAALERVRICGERLPDIFEQADLLLLPGATGAAPVGLAATGDPLFSRMWTALGCPCLGFPGGSTVDGLPLGLQFVGRPERDHEFLPAAEALTRAVAVSLFPPGQTIHAAEA